MELTSYIKMALASVALWLPAPAAEFDVFTRDDGDLEWTVTGKPGQIGCVAIGSVNGRLSFAIFSPASTDGTPVPCAVREKATLGFRSNGIGYLKYSEVLLDRPKGGPIHLPIRAQLIEVRDGKVRLCPQRVTLDELKAYLAIKGAACSLDDLLRFVEAHRKKSKPTK